MNKKIYILPVVVISLLLIGVFGMILLRGSSSFLGVVMVIALFVALFVWVIPVILKRANVKVWMTTGFLILLGLLFPTSSLMSRSYESGPFSTLTSTTIFLLPSLALVNAAFLLFSGLTRRSYGMQITN